MKIAVHIPFIIQVLKEKEKPLNRNKIFFLKKKPISISFSLKYKADVYIHTT